MSVDDLIAWKSLEVYKAMVVKDYVQRGIKELQQAAMDKKEEKEGKEEEKDDDEKEDEEEDEDAPSDKFSQELEEIQQEEKIQDWQDKVKNSELTLTEK